MTVIGIAFTPSLQLAGWWAPSTPWESDLADASFPKKVWQPTQEQVLDGTLQHVKVFELLVAETEDLAFWPHTVGLASIQS